MESETDGGIVYEIQSKYGNSAQPESRQVVAVLQAVIEVIKSEGLTLTPISLFAAIMSALSKTETQESAEAVTAMLTVLTSVLPRVSGSILRSKFMMSGRLLASLLGRHSSSAPLVKAGLSCLGSLMAHADYEEGEAVAAEVLALLVAAMTDARPKVRKRGHEVMVDVIGAAQSSPRALAAVSDALASLCKAVLPGPAVTARAAAAATKQQRPEAEEAITRAVTDALHVLVALKGVMPLMSASAVQSCVDLVFKLYALRQSLLSRTATDTLAALVSSPTSHLPPSTLSKLLLHVLDAGELWDKRDVETVQSLTRLIEGGFTRLASTAPNLASSHLPRAVHTLTSHLGAESEGARLSASRALAGLIRGSVDASMIKSALEGPEKDGAPKPLVSVVAALAGSLGARYQESWVHSLPVVSEMFERLGRHGGAELAEPLLRALDAILTGVFEAGEQGAAVEDPEAVPDEERQPVAAAASATLGAAIRWLGAREVLRVLPLGLEAGLAGRGGARTWLLPLLKRHVVSARLAEYAEDLLPLAREMAARAADATKANKTQLAGICSALELQLWYCFPAFCNRATDTSTAYPAMVKEVAGAFNARPELRPPICAALERLVSQNLRVLRESGHPDFAEVQDPFATLDDEGDGDASEYGASVKSKHSQKGTQSRRRPGMAPKALTYAYEEGPVEYTQEEALANVAALRRFCKNWFNLLSKVFLSSPPQSRTQVASALRAIAAVSEKATLSEFFRIVMTKLIKVIEEGKMDVIPPDAVLEGGADPTSRRISFLELALCLAASLEVNALDTLLRAARPGLQERDHAVQKKCYKVLAFIVQQRPDFLAQHAPALLGDVIAAGPLALSSARRFRIKALAPLIMTLLTRKDMELPSDILGEEDMEASTPEERRQQVVASLLGEVVLGVKETNTRTRTSAYDLLLDLAKRMDETGGDDDDSMGRDNTQGGLYHFITMVLGGLAGSTPHMISATVMALARLVYEYAARLEGLLPQMLPAVMMLLRTKSREVVAAVIGFVKVCAMRMSVEQLTPHLGTILEGLLLWSEDTKNKFKLKIRVIVERLARRCGYDAVAAAMPPSDSRLLVNIRKSDARKARLKAAGSARSVQDDGQKSSRSVVSKSSWARTAGASEWGHTRVFGDEDAERPSRRQQGPGSVGPESTSRRGGAAKGMRLSEAAADPMDLLDASASRRLARVASGARASQARDPADDFKADDRGRLIIEDDELDGGRRGGKRKRGGDADMASDDSDLEDMRGYPGLAEAFRKGTRSVRFAGSEGNASGKHARSVGRGSAAPSSAQRSAASKQTKAAAGKGGQKHSGDRFKPKAKAAGGDIKGKSRVEPYAYWTFDRKMLNRRRDKQRSASNTLATVLGARSGAQKGGRAHRIAKRRKTGTSEGGSRGGATAMEQ